VSTIKVDTIKNRAGTATITTADVTNAPAFEAQVTNNQTISDNTATKVTFDNEIFDSGSKYDHSTNYRFTPTVAGKYFVYLSIGVSAQADTQLQNMYSMLKKNSEAGNTKLSHFNFAANNARYATANINAIITFDSDDYIEAFVQSADSSGSAIVQSGVYTTFGAYKLIGV
jgi:hypothetical protein